MVESKLGALILFAARKQPLHPYKDWPNEVQNLVDFLSTTPALIEIRLRGQPRLLLRKTTSSNN